MKIVVIGGTGLIGSKTVAILRQRGHEVVAASPNTGVNTITGEGLKEAMAGTQVVIDLANSLRWARRASAASVSTNGSAAQRQQPDLHRRYAQGSLTAVTSGSRATNERGDYDDQTGCVGSAVPHDRHGGGSGA